MSPIPASQVHPVTTPQDPMAMQEPEMPCTLSSTECEQQQLATLGTLCAPWSWHLLSWVLSKARSDPQSWQMQTSPYRKGFLTPAQTKTRVSDTVWLGVCFHCKPVSVIFCRECGWIGGGGSLMFNQQQRTILLHTGQVKAWQGPVWLDGCSAREIYRSFSRAPVERNRSHLNESKGCQGPKCPPCMLGQELCCCEWW